jgi:hypothetical protein
VRWWLVVHCGDASLNSYDVAVVRKTMQKKSSVVQICGYSVFKFPLSLIVFNAFTCGHSEN